MIYLKFFSLLNSKEESRLENEEENIYKGTCLRKTDFCSSYPLNIFPQKNLTDIEFDPITIFYGSNGTGKSTLLNIICSKLNIKRETPFNTDSLFNSYVNHCTYILGDHDGKELNIPNNSMFISSDDIFNNIINNRNYNNKILENRDKILNTKRPRFDRESVQTDEPDSPVFQEFDSSVFHDSIIKEYDYFVNFMNFKYLSRTKLIQKYAGTLEKSMSNGEMAISYFDKKLNLDSLYLLDEPENSLSPHFQFDLIKIIEEAAYRCDCQFIISTHSLFILSLSGAKIYNLDLKYVIPQKWYELENVRVYYDFFKKYKYLFEL